MSASLAGRQVAAKSGNATDYECLRRRLFGREALIHSVQSSLNLYNCLCGSRQRSTGRQHQSRFENIAIYFRHSLPFDHATHESANRQDQGTNG
ncbi:hypothetical protein E7681_18625 [Thalassobius vesicularis]|uniref:Uncharacterized protein n=1 Tax=Thalassobius vesicularis TaxID=1294297 RepID=A0A4S3M4E9_9RHOB|nr:hypothetical protein [Thalassobius vesicularis]THD70753.1 hypothetical protein E7681_18625 [Thalassobius vesicularis]